MVSDDSKCIDVYEESAYIEIINLILNKTIIYIKIYIFYNVYF